MKKGTVKVPFSVKPSPSRGGLGGDGVDRGIRTETHPHPDLPIEGEGEGKNQIHKRDAIAFAKPIVLPSPPKSGVSESLASKVAMMAPRRRLACSGKAR